MENDKNNALGSVIARISTQNIITKNKAPVISEDFEPQDFDYPSFDDEPNYDRPQPTMVENFTLLPGEVVLMITKNVVNLSLTTTTHRIGTLYQTNYQMFFIDDSTRQLVSTIANGQLLQIKKLKGHVTVKYHDNNNNSNNNNNNNNKNNNNSNNNNTINKINSSTDQLNSFLLEKQPSENENLNNNQNNNNNLMSSMTTQPSTPSKSRLLKSNSTPINLNESSTSTNSPTLSSTTTSSTNGTINTWYSNGVSEKALILEIRCKDFMITRYCLPFNEKGNEAFELMNKLISNNYQDNNNNSSNNNNNNNLSNQLFSMSYSPFKGIISPIDGWLFYDPIEEYTRQGLIGNSNGSDEWRLTKINSKYDLCSTYPHQFIIPFSISDYLLNKSSSHRNKNRFPVVTWRHKQTHATLSRSSQQTGKSRCEEDELLIQAIRKSKTILPQQQNDNNNNNQQQQTLYIIDIKSTSSPTSSSSSHCEDISHYSQCQIESECLSNIHELRESQLKLFKVIRNWNEKKGWSEIQSTGWLDQLSKLLVVTKKILTHLHLEGLSCLIHCIDGWDRTCQLSSLVQLCADPYYRTIKGFIVLISKEWLSFGHKFMTRNGQSISSTNSTTSTSSSSNGQLTSSSSNTSISSNSTTTSTTSSKQTSPVFLQFIDVVWQLTKQFPTSFEFSDSFLSVILHHLNSNLFGTFLYDSEKERQQNNLSNETQSLWTLLLSAQKNSSLLNPLFNQQLSTTVNENSITTATVATIASTTTTSLTNSTSLDQKLQFKNNNDDGVLFPNPKGVQLWSDYYLKWRNPPKASRKSNTLITHSLGVSHVNGDLIAVQKKRRSRRSKDGASGSSSKHHHHHHHHHHRSKPSEEKDSKEKSSKSSRSRTSSSSKRKSLSTSSNSNNQFDNKLNETLATPTTAPTTLIKDETINESIQVNNDKLKSPSSDVIKQEQDDINQFTSQHHPNNQMESSLEIKQQNEQSQLEQNEQQQQQQQQQEKEEQQKEEQQKELRTYSMESDSQSSVSQNQFQQQQQQQQQTLLDPIDESLMTTTTTTTTTTTSTTTTTITSASKLEKELRKQEKEKRKLEKEKKHKERAERKLEKEKKRDQKEREQKEKELLEQQKPKADITVVLQSPSKSKAMSLTMPVRGTKSRISIFSSPLTPSTLHPNLNDQNSQTNSSGDNSGNVNNSPNLTSTPISNLSNNNNNNNNIQQNSNDNSNNDNNYNNNNTSFSKRIFKTLRGTKTFNREPTSTVGTALN
ncbi:hypothetical protein ACTFIV_008371 [Dictyostelium citrinum]